MKIKSIFFLCLVIMTLFFNNKTYTMTDGRQFFGLFATIVIGGVVIYKANAGQKTVEAAASGFFSGASQVIVLPAAKIGWNILRKPFVNPIDEKINDLIEERKSLSLQANTFQQTASALQQTAQPAAQTVGKKDQQTLLKAQQKKIENLIHVTIQQQLKLEKAITKLHERQVFDREKSNLIFL